MPSEITFYLLAILTVTAAIAAMGLRDPLHCALSAAGAFAGLAAIYLELDAEFVGFAQLLVYVGAIAILIVFTLMLTPGTEAKAEAINWPAGMTGLAVAALVLACIVVPIGNSPSLHRHAPSNVTAPVAEIGQRLMASYVVPLETIGLLLTAALLGAAVIAIREEGESKRKLTDDRRGEQENSAPGPMDRSLAVEK